MRVRCILQNGWTALILAANDNYRDVAQLLLDKGADVNAKNQVSGSQSGGTGAGSVCARTRACVCACVCWGRVQD